MIRNILSAVIILLTMSVSLSAAAETKIVERSAKKAPEWITDAADGYLVVTVRAASIAEAQKQAEEEIAGRMIMSVARNVMVSQSNTVSETVRNGYVESSDEYRRTSAMRSANLPFLKGISLAKAEEVYWVKLRDKKTKEEFYDYSIKYPFFRVEQEKLIAEFEAYDAEKDAQYDRLESQYATVDSPEAIRAAIDDLKALEAYYFDDVRRTAAKNLAKRYAALFKAIVLDGEFTSPNKLHLSYSLLGHDFKVYTAPKVSANCASSIRVKPSNGAFDVIFDTADCLDDEENYLDVAARIEGTKFEQRFPLREATTGTKEKFSVVPTGKLVLIADSIDTATGTIANIEIRFTVDNRGTTEFGLKSIELSLPSLVVPIIWDDIDNLYSDSGIIQINACAPDAFKIRAEAKSKLNYANGAMTIVNPLNGKTERIRISLPYSCNWE